VIDVSPMNRIVEIDRGRGLVDRRAGRDLRRTTRGAGARRSDGRYRATYGSVGDNRRLPSLRMDLEPGRRNIRARVMRSQASKSFYPTENCSGTGSAALAGAGFFHRYAIGPT